MSQDKKNIFEFSHISYETFARIIYAPWDGNTIANHILEAFNNAGELTDLIDSICFASITICDDDAHYISTHLSRGDQAEVSFRANCDKWEQKDTNLRHSDYFKRGLVDEAFSNTDNATSFWRPVGEGEQEYCGALWGRVFIGEENRPQTGLDSADSPFCRYIGCCDEERDNVSQKNDSTDKREKKFEKFFRKNYKIPSKTSLVKQTNVSRAEASQRFCECSKEVFFNETTQYVDAYNRRIATNYAIPFIFGGNYFGRMRIGFSSKPKPEEFSRFLNVVFKATVELYEIYRCRMVSSEKFSAERDFEKKRLDRLDLLQRIYDLEQKEYFSRNDVRDAYKALFLNFLNGRRFAKYVKNLVMLQITIPTLNKTYRSQIDAKDLAVTSGLSFDFYSKDFKVFESPKPHACYFSQIVKELEDKRRTYLTPGSNLMFQQGLNDLSSLDNWQKLPSRTEMTRRLMELRQKCKELKRKPNTPLVTDDINQINKQRRKIVHTLNTLRHILDDFKEDFGEKDVDYQSASQDLLNMRIAGEGKKSRYLIAIDKNTFNNQRLGNLRQDDTEEISVSEVDNASASSFKSLTVDGTYDDAEIKVKEADYPISLGIWSVFAGLRQADKLGLSICDATGRKGSLLVGIPIMYGGVCYRLFALFSETSEYAELINGRQNIVDSQYFDDLYDMFYDVTFHLGSVRVAARVAEERAMNLETEARMLRAENKNAQTKAENAQAKVKEAEKIARRARNNELRMNYFDGHDSISVITRLNGHIGYINQNFQRLVWTCACSEARSSSEEQIKKIMKSFSNRPSIPSGSLTSNLEIIHREIQRKPGNRELSDQLRSIDKTLAKCRWATYDLEAIYRVRDMIGRASDIENSVESESIRKNDSNSENFIGRFLSKEEWYSETDANVIDILTEAEDVFNRDQTAADSKLRPLEIRGKERLNDWIIATIGRRLDDKEVRMLQIRPGNFFYRVILASLLRNISRHGDGRQTVQVTYGVAENFAGTNDNAIIISNSATPKEAVPSKWVQVSREHFPDYSGLLKHNLTLETTRIGILFIRFQDGLFEVAVVLKGLQKRKG